MASLDEAFFIANQVANLNYIASHAIFEDLDSLRCRDAAREKLDEVAGVEYGGGIISSSSRSDSHAAFYEVERACYLIRVNPCNWYLSVTGTYMMGCKRASDEWPCFPKVDLPVFWKEGCKGRFFNESASSIV